MEIKKSHKADLEHLRPWMFLAGVVLTILLFVGVMELRVLSSYLSTEDDDEFTMNLELTPNDERDLIAAAEKKPKSAGNTEEGEKKESGELNKVDEMQQMMQENEELFSFQPGENLTAEDFIEEDEDEPINLNDDDPETLRKVRELPEYPGGMVEFMKWLTLNLRYPPAALRTKIEGTVMISFIVNKDGSISNIKIEKHAHSLLENEALRVAGMMPKWKPGTDHGKVCRSQVAIPIVFEI